MMPFSDFERMLSAERALGVQKPHENDATGSPGDQPGACPRDHWQHFFRGSPSLPHPAGPSSVSSSREGMRDPRRRLPMMSTGGECETRYFEPPRGWGKS